MGRRFKPKMETIIEVDSQKYEDNRNESLLSAFERKYPKYADNFKDRFESATGMPFEWSSINLPNLDRFIQYLRMCGLGDNSINQYGRKMMAILNLYRDIHSEIPDTKRLSNVLNTELDDSYEVALEDSEIDSLYNYLSHLMNSEHTRVNHQRVDRLQYRIEVLTYFLLSVDTGARLSDVKTFSWDNISEGVDSEGNKIYVLTYTSNKRGIKASLPISKDSRVIQLLKNMMPLTVCDRECNKYIKKICKEAGLYRVIKRRRAGKDETTELWKAVHFHLARKSLSLK